MTGFEGLFGSQLPCLTEEERKFAAWSNAIPTSDPNVRIDCDGRAIAWGEYGKNSKNGWHIDHANPLALGGLETSSNLRARHWYGNCSAGGLLSSLLK